MRRNLFLVSIGALLINVSADGQLADEFNPPRANCCLINTARGLADQLQDWNQLGRYHQANEELKKQPADPKRVVFMGDSITDFWRLDQYFPGKPYVNRGIGGQTTPQMLVRMYPDVIDLKPAAMIVLAGTNDIARNTGPMTAELIEENIMAMTELAQHHGIKVILCSGAAGQRLSVPETAKRGGAPPAAAGPGRGPFPRRQDDRRASWRRHSEAEFVDEGLRGAGECDLRGLLHAAGGSKGMAEGRTFPTTACIPTRTGYKIMAPIAAAAIEKALR